MTHNQLLIHASVVSGYCEKNTLIADNCYDNLQIKFTVNIKNELR